MERNLPDGPIQNQRPLRKISDHCRDHHGIKNPPPREEIPIMLREEQILDFQGSPSSSEYAMAIPDIRILVVFPHMKAPFQSEEVRRMWTDDIVVPSILPYVHHRAQRKLRMTRYEILRLASEPEQEFKMGVKVRGTPVCFAFKSDNFDGIWADIVAKTQQEEFEAFEVLFSLRFGSGIRFPQSTNLWKALGKG